MTTIIVQYDRNMKELRRDALENAPGLSYGVKEDVLKWRKVGVYPNWSRSAIPTSTWLEIIQE
jgi:hypothetical protein